MKNTVSLLLGLSLLTFVIGCAPKEPPKDEKPTAGVAAPAIPAAAPAGTTAK